ncbi:hypothetical protein [Methylobacterium aerolatum]|uniref:Uncharacterized protein n=1 Tax=Methylobacterium aerolatum TaxID=418708 RepID=A0ABU0I3S7_9HYPH|nr:hypothetical protein [Methylobacterium aerolatum]MDQ0449256.1 hypothetical protein [Methylobacterium aerolatum]GJD35440.1 hypothetical protein FMGBMHLM_2350 [Methylobacterium aerolatum]
MVQTMGKYAIYLRNVDQADASQPHLLAYDIDGLQQARSLVSSIARSYRDHGQHSGTGVHWFRQGDSLHEIYPWPAQ